MVKKRSLGNFETSKKPIIDHKKLNEPPFSGFLKTIDMFNYNPELLYDGEPGYRSAFGGYTTLFILSCYILTIAFTIWRYFQRYSPETNVSTQYVENPKGFELTKDTFPFAFGIQDKRGAHFIDESIYTFKGNYRLTTKTVENGELKSNTKRINFEFIRCSEAGLDLEMFKNLDLNSMYCLKEFAQKMNEIFVTGVWESDTFGSLSFDAFRCDNKTSPIPCATNEAIDLTLRSSYFAINYVTFTTQSTDYANPIKKVPASFFATTSIDYKKSLTVYMTDNEILTESSLIGYSEPAVKYFTSVGNFRSDFSNLVTTSSSTGFNKLFFNFAIRMETSKTVTHRNYKRIYEYLAEFGGMSQVIVIVGLVLTFRMRKINMFMDLAEKVVRKEQEYQNLVKEATKEIKTGTFTTDKSMKKKEEKLGILGRDQKKVITEDTTTKRAGLLTKPEPSEKRKVSNRSSLEREGFHVPDEGLDRQMVRETAPNESHLQSIGVSRGQKRGKMEAINYNISTKKNEKLADSNSQSVSISKHSELAAFTSMNMAQAVEKESIPLDDISCNIRVEKESKEGHVDTIEERLDTESNYDMKKLETQMIKEEERFNQIKQKIDTIGCFKMFLKGFLPCFTKKSRVSSAVSIAENYFYSKYDLVKIIEVIEEVDKLKQMLFSREQKILFELIPSTKLKFDQASREFIVVQEHKMLSLARSATLDADKQREENRKIVKKAYSDVRTKKEKTDLDINLLNSLKFLSLARGDSETEKNDVEG